MLRPHRTDRVVNVSGPASRRARWRRLRTPPTRRGQGRWRRRGCRRRRSSEGRRWRDDRGARAAAGGRQGRRDGSGRRRGCVHGRDRARRPRSGMAERRRRRRHRARRRDRPVGIQPGISAVTGAVGGPPYSSGAITTSPRPLPAARQHDVAQLDLVAVVERRRSILRPLTNTPLALPLSRTARPSGPASITAWRREHLTSLRTRSHGGSRPTMATRALKLDLVASRRSDIGSRSFKRRFLPLEVQREPILAGVSAHRRSTAPASRGYDPRSPFVRAGPLALMHHSVRGRGARLAGPRRPA